MPLFDMRVTRTCHVTGRFTVDAPDRAKAVDLAERILFDPPEVATHHIEWDDENVNDDVTVDGTEGLEPPVPLVLCGSCDQLVPRTGVRKQSNMMEAWYTCPECVRLESEEAVT